MRKLRGDYRPYANSIIVKIINDNPGLTEKEYRKLFRPAYPFPDYSHQRKIWNDEINQCLIERGIKDGKKKKDYIPGNPQQTDLFK